MLSDKIELRSAAARLLYGNNRDSADYDMLVDYIDSSEPVQHGWWVDNKHTDTALCSECGKCVTDETPYCPYCGAKMDGGTDK